MSERRREASRRHWELRRKQWAYSDLIEARERERSFWIKMAAAGIVAWLYGLYRAWSGDRDVVLEAVVVIVPLAFVGASIKGAIECHGLVRLYRSRKAAAESRLDVDG